jgi:hypothetical protein
MNSIRENSIEDDLNKIENGGWDEFFDEEYDDPYKAKEIHAQAKNSGMSDLDYVNKMDILDQLYEEDDWIYDIETENDDFNHFYDKFSPSEVYENYKTDWENGETSLFGPWGPMKIENEEELLKNTIQTFWENGIADCLPYGGPQSLQEALNKLSKYANDKRTPACKSLYIFLTKIANEFNGIAENIGIEKPLNIPTTLQESTLKEKCYDKTFIEDPKWISEIDKFVKKCSENGHEALMTVICSDGSNYHTTFTPESWEKFKNSKQGNDENARYNGYKGCSILKVYAWEIDNYGAEDEDRRPMWDFTNIHESIDEDEFWDEEYERTHPEFYDPYDGISDDELMNTLDESAKNKFKSDKSAKGRVWSEKWNQEHAGASNLDFFGEYLLEKIKNNLKEIICNIGGKQKQAINIDRTELSIDKDPAPDESIKERKIRGWVYFNSNFDIILDDRQILKRKVIQAFKAGMVDFNDEYKNDYLVCRDMLLISNSFKYGNDNKSMYLVFRVSEERFHNEKPTFIVHKQTRESKNILKEGYHCWEDFYKKGCKLGIKSYMEKLDILHDKYGGFKNVPKDEIQFILDAIPDNDYDVYNFVEEMIDYFDF